MNLLSQVATAASSGAEVTWVDIATLVVAAVGGLVGALAWITTSHHERRGRQQTDDTRAIDQGFVRYNTAVGYLYSGDANLALEGVGILRDLRTAAWLDDAMKARSADALRNYTRSRSTSGSGSTT